MTHVGDPALRPRVDAALRDLDEIRSSDPAASAAIAAVKLAAHTLRCHLSDATAVDRAERGAVG